jgi:hypothetical protein
MGHHGNELSFLSGGNCHRRNQAEGSTLLVDSSRAAN